MKVDARCYRFRTIFQGSQPMSENRKISVPLGTASSNARCEGSQSVFRKGIKPVAENNHARRPCDLT